MTNLPSGTIAVLIALEDYAFSTDSRLDGPVNDLVQFARWLIAKGVEPANIIVVAAPMRTNRADLDGLGLAWREADRDTIYRVLATEVPAASSDLLIISIGGHGFMHERERRVLYAEATSQSKLNLNLTSLLDSMRTNLFAAHRNQLIFVDACLTHSQDMRWTHGVTNETFPLGSHYIECDQRAYFAVGPGQEATNDDVSRTGLFSAALRGTLAGPIGDELLATPPGELMADVRTRLAELKNAGRTEPEPTYLAYSSNGTEQVLVDVPETAPGFDIAMKRSIRNVVLASTAVIVAAIVVLAIALWPDTPDAPHPMLAVGEFKMGDPTKLEANYTGDTGMSDGKTKTQVESTAANIVVQNNGPAPAVVTAVKVEILFAQRLDDCARGGGGPGQVDTGYLIDIPDPLPALPFTITSERILTIAGMSSNWMAVHIGPRAQNLSIAKPYVFAARISLVHDKADAPLEVGVAAAVATPYFAEFQVQNVNDHDCVKKMSAVLDKLYEIPAERSSELDMLQRRYHEVLAADASNPRPSPTR